MHFYTVDDGKVLQENSGDGGSCFCEGYSKYAGILSLNILLVAWELRLGAIEEAQRLVVLHAI
jgi:hypothetical protein